MTPFTDDAVNEPLPEFVPFIDYHICWSSSTESALFTWLDDDDAFLAHSQYADGNCDIAFLKSLFIIIMVANNKQTREKCEADLNKFIKVNYREHINT